MPTVLVIGPYRFFFYASDRNEPFHVHIEREDCIAKFWLGPVRLERSGGFGRSELSDLQHLTEENEKLIMEKWNEYFGKG